MKEINLDGVYMAPFVGDLAAALLIFWLLRRVLIHHRIEERVWHPQLFNLSIFVIILSVIVLLF